MVNFVDSELIIKTLYDLFSFLWVYFQDSEASINHVFRVVPGKERSGIDELVDLVEINRVFEFVIKKEKGIEG